MNAYNIYLPCFFAYKAQHMLDPRWRFVYSHFHTVILRLFQTFIFERKLPNLLIELWELFYYSYFDKQGLNFNRFGSYWTKY